MATFEPDEPITKIRIQLHTSAVSDASTDSDIFVELFDWPQGIDFAFPFAVEIDTSGYNDFEGGDTKWYSLPKYYYQGRIVNDIRRICLHKGDDWGTDWGFGWVSVEVNGKELWTSPGFNHPEVPTWLSDGEKWCGGYQPIEFVAPTIENLGLPDAKSNVAYSFTFRATGGRKKLSWKIVSSSGTAFTSPPTITVSNADGTEAVFSAKTVITSTTASWKGRIRVTDVDGRFSEKDVEMRVIFALPKPTIAGFSPTFGWPGVAPSEPTPVVVTVNSTGKDFDSRESNATEVFFTSASSGTVEGQLVPGELTSSRLRVRVPKGATPGAIRVRTAFGEATSAQSFTAHPCGYRFISGFSFDNRCDDDDNTDGFPNTFDWLRFEQTFGLDEMWLVAFDQALVPNPIATFFYITAHDTIGNGCCHGFSLASLQMIKGIIPNSTLPDEGEDYPLDDSLWDLSAPERPTWVLSNLIQNRQLVVFSDEALSYYLHTIDTVPNVSGMLCQMDAGPALADFKAAIAGGLSNPRMLAFAADCAPWRGHVVVPYAIEEQANTTDFRIYNPNTPARKGQADDGESRIWVKKNGTWGFTWSDGELWDGLYMFTIPLTEYGHQLDWSIPGFGALTDLVGTFILGCAGTDSDGEIVQVADEAGRTLFDEQGALRTDRSQWPGSARQVPIMGEGGRRRTLIAVTGKDPVQFTVRSRPVRPPGTRQPATFALVQGADYAVSVEEFTDAHAIRFEPASHAVDVAPITGQSTPIVRLSRRFPATRESLSYAVRVHAADPASRIRLEPTADGRGVLFRPGGRKVTFDVEVTHTSEIGQQRVLECGALVAEASSVSTLVLTNPDDIDRSGTTPLLRRVEAEGAPGQGVEERLGHRPSGPTVAAPHRIIPRPSISIGDKNPLTVEAQVRVNLSGSRPSTSSGTLRHQIRGGIKGTQEGDILSVPLCPGMHPLRIVAEDDAGLRSFPRTVYVSVAEPGQRVVPVRTLFGGDVVIPPGTSGTIPVGVYVQDSPTSKVTAELSIRDRRSGLGTERALLEGTVVLSPELQAAGAKVTASATLGGLMVQLEITWDQAKPRAGRIDLGALTVRVPAGVAMGGSFFVRGKGTAVQRRGREESALPLNVLPMLVKVWGGSEPSSVKLNCPATVAEEKEIHPEVILEGLPAGARNIGWWLEPLGGVATIRQDVAAPTRALVTGKRAGRVRVCAVAGTQTVSQVIKVTPTAKPDLIRMLREFRFTRRVALNLRRK